MTSPNCSVIVNGGSPVSTTGGVDVPPNATISISLSSTTNVTTWFLECFGTDELSTAPTLANVNPTTHQVSSPSAAATYVYPNHTGRAMGFRSTIVPTSGPNQITTFGIYSRTAANFRVGFVNETNEGDPLFGWETKTNPVIRIANLPVFVDDSNVTGGYHAVLDESARDSISSSARKLGMLVTTTSDGRYWRLSGSLDNSGWIEVTLGGGGGSGGGADQGLTQRRVELDLTTAAPQVLDILNDLVGAEFTSVATLRTWVPKADTATSGNFTMPSAGSNVDITVLDASAYSTNTTPAQIMLVQSAGYFQVMAVSGSTITAKNLGYSAPYSGNAVPSTVINSGSAVSLPNGNSSDTIVYGRSDGTVLAIDEFTGSEAWQITVPSGAGATVIASRDLLLAGGSTAFSAVRATSGGPVGFITGLTDTMAGGAAVTANGFDNFPTNVIQNGRWAFFSSPSTGNIFSVDVSSLNSINTANLGPLQKPHGMVVDDDGFLWVAERVDDSSAHGRITQYLPLSSGAIDPTSYGTLTGFLAQSQIVHTGRYIFGLDCTGEGTVLNRLSPATKVIDSYVFNATSTADRSSLYFDGIGLWVTLRNMVLRVDPQNFGVEYMFQDLNINIDHGVITGGPSGSIYISFINTSNNHVGIRKFQPRKVIEASRLRVTSISANSVVATNASGELVAGNDVPINLTGDITGTTASSVVSAIQGVGAPVASIGDDGKAVTFDELNNRYRLLTVGSATWVSSTVSAGIVNKVDVEGQNAPMIGPDIGQGSVVAFHKPAYGRDSFSMQPTFRWPYRARGMELYLPDTTATDLTFTDKYLVIVRSSISDFPVTLHDPASGQQVAQLPSSSIGSSGWDQVYFVTQEKLTDGTAPNAHFLYLQKTGTNEMARINLETGDADLFTSPSSTNGPIYVHESGTIAWMAGGTMVYTSQPCEPTVPTIQTSSLTGKDVDDASNIVVVPHIYNVSFSQSGLTWRAWITQPLSELLVFCDFPSGDNSGAISYSDGAGHTRPRQIAFDGTHLYINAMTTGYPGDTTVLGAISRFDPITQFFADSDDNTQGCSDDGMLLADGKFIIASDSSKTNDNVTTDNDDSIHIRSTNTPIVSANNGLARMGGLRIAHPTRIAVPRNGSPFFGLYAICNAPVPGVYRYLDRAPLFAQSVNLAGGFIDHVERTPIDYIVTSFDSTLALHDLTGNITLTLPSLPVLGQTFIIVDEDGSLGTWWATIDGNGNDVNGAPTYIMGGSVELARQSITIKWTGGQWSIV
jgi:hypothetical protein